MITKRIIPCLDVKDGRVVKGVNFEGLNDVSSPVELGKYYSDCGADELVFYDITASSDGRKLFTDILKEVASNIFIPLPQQQFYISFCLLQLPHFIPCLTIFSITSQYSMDQTIFCASKRQAVSSNLAGRAKKPQT